MKKIILTVCFLILAQIFAPHSAFADEIIDSKGNLTQCKIITVCEGLIEYEKDGCLYSMQRIDNQKVFNDYVDIRTKIFKKEEITRRTGKIITKDFVGVKIRTNGEDIQIPCWRVKSVGLYNPN